LYFRALLFVLCVCVSFWGVPASAGQTKSKSTSTHHSAKRRRGRSPRGPRAPEPDRIKEIQGALAREGYYHGEPTGKWDEATAAAMKNFQQAKGLQPSGKIEALSLQKLGLGSPVAGVAAPAPAAPASAPPHKPR